MTPIEELKKGLDELGVEYDTYDLPNGEHGVSWIDGNNIEWEAVQQGENFRIHALQLVTPEQAIAATVERENVNLREMLSESRQANERLYTELERYKRIFRTRPIAMNILFDENDKLRDIAHKAWRLLLATGNDDLVLSVEANGVVKEIIDAEELAKAMRELGIKVGDSA